MKYKISFMDFSKIVEARGYKIACKKALEAFFKKRGYPKRLSALIQIQKRIKFGWGNLSFWDMREALKNLGVRND